MGGNAAEDKGIAAVKHATMTWDEIPGVLHTDPALNPRLNKVAEDTQYRNGDAAQQRHGNVELINTSSIKDPPILPAKPSHVLLGEILGAILCLPNLLPTI